MRADLRLALPVGVAWAILAVVIAFPEALAATAVCAWLAVLACSLTAVATRRGWLAGVAVVLAAVALLVTVAALQLSGRQPAVLNDAAGHGRAVQATIVTTQTVHPSDGMFDATMIVASIAGRSVQVHVPVLVFRAPDATGAAIGIGATMRADGTLVAGDIASGAAFSFFARSQPLLTAAPPGILDWANELREMFRVAAAALPGDGGDLLPGLAIGDTSAVDDSLDQAMKASSLSHLTAVSGANCAVVIGIVMLAGARLRLSRMVRVCLSVAVLAGFVVLVTPEPSVLRAAVMATIVLVALSAGRPLRGIPVLALAVMVLLVIDPWLCREYGFVLSVLATGGLLVLAGPIAKLLTRWLPASIAAVIAVPLAAQLACQPVLILLAPTIPTYGIVANVLAEPAAPIATVLGLVACLCLPWAPVVGGFIAWLAWLPAAWIAGIARFFADAPGNSIPWPPGGLGVILLAAVTICGLFAAFRDGGRIRWIAAGVLALVLVVCLGVAAGDAVRLRLLRPGDWQFAACDIGQGDAVLIRSLGIVALVDTGPDPKLLSRCLDSLGIDRIDLLILSHYDQDHAGGTSAVLGRVDRAVVGPTGNPKDERLVGDLARSGAIIEEAVKGMTGILGELRWEVLWPKEGHGGVEPGNDASVTVGVAGAGECLTGCLSALFLGDLGEQAQSMVASANVLDRVDVVKVAHHGSADQYARLYEQLHATVGLISVGAENGYGHPTPKLLGMLAAVGTRATRTDLQGMVLLSPGPDGTVRVWSERATAEHGVGKPD